MRIHCNIQNWNFVEIFLLKRLLYLWFFYLFGQILIRYQWRAWRNLRHCARDYTIHRIQLRELMLKIVWDASPWILSIYRNVNTFSTIHQNRIPWCSLARVCWSKWQIIPFRWIFALISVNFLCCPPNRMTGNISFWLLISYLFVVFYWLCLGAYIVNYLATRGPKMQSFVIASLIQLLCRLTKFGWLDDDRFRDVVNESTNFLEQVVHLLGSIVTVFLWFHSAL